MRVLLTVMLDVLRLQLLRVFSCQPDDTPYLQHILSVRQMWKQSFPQQYMGYCSSMAYVPTCKWYNSVYMTFQLELTCVSLQSDANTVS